MRHVRRPPKALVKIVDDRGIESLKIVEVKWWRNLSICGAGRRGRVVIDTRALCRSHDTSPWAMHHHGNRNSYGLGPGRPQSPRFRRVAGETPASVRVRHSQGALPGRLAQRTDPMAR